MFHCINTCRVPRMMLNTRPIGLVFKQHPRDRQMLMHEKTCMIPIFINYLPDCVQSSTRLFADDCTLCRRIRNQHDSAILQDDLNKLASLEKKWGIAFHPDKCSAIRISRSRKTASMNYTLKGHVLQNEDYTRHLGVELQSNLSWNRQNVNSML